jgi:hypothetical protein
MGKNMIRRYVLVFLFCTAAVFLSTQNNLFYEGTGGAGIRIAVLQPIGNLTNAHYILARNLAKTGSGFMLELSVSDAQTGERKASFPPKNCTLDELQSTAIIKQAEEDMLSQLGITLTAVIIPCSVTAIGDSAFSQCTKLKTVTLLNNSVTIGRRAFMGCPLTNKDEMISRYGATIFN